MQQTRVRPMVEGGVLSAVALIFALISAYLPIVGPFVNLIWPVPIILLGVRHGYKWSMLATAVAGVLIAILMHPLHAVSVVVGFGLIGIVLGHAFRADYSPGKTLLWGTLASLISKVAVLAIGAVVMGINPLNMQTDAMSSAVDQALGMYRSMGMSEENLQQMSGSMQAMINLVKIILPAGFGMAAVLDTYLNFVIAKAVLKKLGHQVAPFPPFRRWNLPPFLAYIFILSIVGMYWGKVKEIDMLYKAAMNFQVITSMFLLLQGLALFYFLADKYKLSRFVRGIILVLLLTNGFLTQGVIFAGGFDMAVDYRRLRRLRSE
ncbi:MAG: YybS family protein [Veillonellales bacterium]